MFSRDKLHYRAIPLQGHVARDDAQMRQRAADYLALMARRHTVRDFDPRPVPLSVIADCVATAGRAPSGANHQPWHFAVIGDPAVKARIRAAAEEEEKAFYEGGAGDEWIRALEPLGTGISKPHLEVAPWLIIVFAQRWGEFDDGTRYKNYYVPESVGIACGFLVSALHNAGLVSLTHTPNPMKFLNGLLGRPASEKPVMIIAAGHPAADATIPEVATIKKPLDEIMSVFESESGA